MIVIHATDTTIETVIVQVDMIVNGMLIDVNAVVIVIEAVIDIDIVAVVAVVAVVIVVVETIDHYHREVAINVNNIPWKWMNIAKIQ
jgi:hypothetical protein